MSSSSSSDPVSVPGGKLTPKSSFSYSHSPQEGNNGSANVPVSGTGNNPRLSLNMSNNGGSVVATSGIPSSSTSNSICMTSTPVGAAAAPPAACSSVGGGPVVMTPTSSTGAGGGFSGGINSDRDGSFRSNSKVAELKRKPSLHVTLPKFGSQGHGGSSDSLNNGRSPHSPGSIVGDEQQQQNEEKELSYKAQRKNYRREKQRVAQELTFALKDPSIIILTGALKVRGKLKGWTKLLAVLKPGLLLFYKGKVKSSHWVATVLLHCCKVIERPSKKEGFCFKVFHPLEQSIWATKGPNGETMGAVVQPLPATYLICRAASTDEGKCWMDGLELALTCSSLLVRSPRTSEIMDSDKISGEMENDMDWGNSDMEETSRVRSDSEKSDSDTSHHDENHAQDFSEEDGEMMGGLDGSRTSDVGGTAAAIAAAALGESVFKRQGSTDVDDPIVTQQGVRQRRKKSVASSSTNSNTNAATGVDIVPTETHYVPRVETDFYHTRGETSEVLAAENQSLLWFLLKQVRPGMDLSRVVLPTFILEPRSFLEKLSDYYYHADLLSKAVQENDAYQRMQSVLRWYLSGFYKKPKGLKKPYNPILGETYRCYWEHPNGSRTFYLAEQVSHHPPVSAFYVSNKKDGYVISAAILAKSKFYGNSTSALLDGQATLTMLPRGETYVITMPYAHCKGILVGNLSMELGGTVSIICEKTGYFTELEFKLKGFLGRADSTNGILGKIKLGRETIATIDGHWDSKITLKNKRNGSEEVLWEVTDKVRSQRLKKFTVPLEEQLPQESEKKWIKVTEAIVAENQENATLEKTALEDEQRKAVADRAEAGTVWLPKHFVFDGVTWRYRQEDLRPWDDGNDLKEFEHDYIIEVHRRHQTPIMRTSSLISVESKVNHMNNKVKSSLASKQSSVIDTRKCHQSTNTLPSSSHASSNLEINSTEETQCNKENAETRKPESLIGLLSSLNLSDEETLEQVDEMLSHGGKHPQDSVVPAFQSRESNRQLVDLLRQLLARQIQQSEQIEELRTTVASIQAAMAAKPKAPKDPFPVTNTILAVIFAVAMQILMITYWFGDGRLLGGDGRK